MNRVAIRPREDDDPYNVLWAGLMGVALVVGGIGLAAGLLFLDGFVVETVLWVSARPLGGLIVVLLMTAFAAASVLRLLGGSHHGGGQMPRLN